MNKQRQTKKYLIHILETIQKIFSTKYNVYINSAKDPTYLLDGFASKEQIENVWIIGGAQIYNYALKNNLIDEIYLTEVQTKLTGENLVGIDPELIKTNFNVIDFTAPKPTETFAFYFKHLKRKQLN